MVWGCQGFFLWTNFLAVLPIFRSKHWCKLAFFCINHRGIALVTLESDSGSMWFVERDYTAPFLLLLQELTIGTLLLIFLMLVLLRCWSMYLLPLYRVDYHVGSSFWEVSLVNVLFYQNWQICFMQGAFRIIQFWITVAKLWDSRWRKHIRSWCFERILCKSCNNSRLFSSALLTIGGIEAYTVMGSCGVSLLSTYLEDKDLGSNCIGCCSLPSLHILHSSCIIVHCIFTEYAQIFAPVGLLPLIACSSLRNGVIIRRIFKVCCQEIL